MKLPFLAGLVALSASLLVTFRPVEAAVATDYDVILRGGTIHDGNGGKPSVGDIADEPGAAD